MRLVIEVTVEGSTGKVNVPEYEKVCHSLPFTGMLLGTVVVMFDAAGFQSGPPSLYQIVSDTAVTFAALSPVFFTKIFP